VPVGPGALLADVVFRAASLHDFAFDAALCTATHQLLPGLPDWRPDRLHDRPA
tara:strand:+ start:1577 stop:1735 length:159 start_codon:yes stop_codon:yes gene_type:complete